MINIYTLSLLQKFPHRALSSVISGHTLKYITVAIAGFTVCYMLLHRTLKDPEFSREPSGKAFSVSMVRVAEDSTRVKPVNAPIAREFD